MITFTDFDNLKFSLILEEDYNVLSLVYGRYTIGYIEFEYIDNNYEYFENNYTETEYKSLFPNDKLVYVENVYIEKDYRSQGFATSLMNKLFEVVKENGYKHILLNSKVDKSADITQDNLTKQYNKLGFIVVKKSDRYTEMWKEL